MAKEQSKHDELKVVEQEPVTETTAITSTIAAANKTGSSTGAESPRTARDPDFDDDDAEASHLPVPETQAVPQKKRVSFQDDHEEVPAPPPKPPRPMSPNAQAAATLIEAFPTIDAKVIRAVLVASGGQVEPAFNALLGMSDPDFQEPQPPPPPRKSSRTAHSQMEADAIYARQLAQHYDNQESMSDGYGSRSRGDPPLPRRRQQTGLKPNELYDDREHSFIDDDLPVIKQNIQKGFEDTRKTLNKWFTDLTKKLDGDESDDPIPRPGPSQNERYDFGPSTHEQLYGIQKNAEARKRNEERARAYDADPQVLSDDFGHRLELRDDEQPPARPPRPAANPNLFKSGADASGQETGIAPAGIRASPSINRQASPAGAGGAAKTGKWQPLSSIEPRAEFEDRDPFSLGDSDEEIDNKKETGSPVKAAPLKTIELADKTDTETATADKAGEKAEETKEEKK